MCLNVGHPCLNVEKKGPIYVYAMFGVYKIFIFNLEGGIIHIFNLSLWETEYFLSVCLRAECWGVLSIASQAGHLHYRERGPPHGRTYTLPIEYSL